MIKVVTLYVAVFSVSAIGTDLFRRYALARRVLDVPNARSSHRVPTPRGGGVAILAGFVFGVLGLWRLGYCDTQITVALVGAGMLVAFVGFLDDHHPVAVGWRLVAHFAAAAWALLWLGGLPPVQLFGRVANLGIGGDIFAAVGLVWLLNLYNFMDGIDGIAATEAATVCLGAALVAAIQIGPAVQWALPGALGIAACGFLLWNFPPARIFMGDGGSGFLGLTLGVLAIGGSRFSATWIWCWIILLGVFIVDATVTLVSRLLRRERAWDPHRSHAYQVAAMRRGAHRPVTVAVGAINLCWLLPVALLVALGRLDGVSGVLIAYAPLVVAAVRVGAGRLPEA